MVYAGEEYEFVWPTFGLIEGPRGAGLGARFLRHRALPAAAACGRRCRPALKPYAAYRTICEAPRPTIGLARKPALVALKLICPGRPQAREPFNRRGAGAPVPAATGEGLDQLVLVLAARLRLETAAVGRG